MLQPENIISKLMRENRIRTIHFSLAIEQNTLTKEQVTAVINEKMLEVLGDESLSAVQIMEKIGLSHSPTHLERII